MSVKEDSAVKTYKHYTQKMKNDAVAAYLLLGTPGMAAAAVGMPKETLTSWTKQTWFKEQIEEIKQSENIAVSSKLKRILDKSLDVMEDRMDKGDFFYDQKLGELVRKPINLRDAAAVAQVVSVQQSNIKTVEQVEMAQESINDKLEKLAQSFAAFAKAKPVVEVTDVIFAEGEQSSPT